MPIKWIPPVMEALGITKRPLDTGYLSLQRSIYPDRGPGYGSQMSLTVLPGYAFSCCGAGSISGLSGQFTTDKDMQETALALYNFFAGGYITYYAIASTSQLQNAKTLNRSVLELLLDLGFVEVHKTPNRNHGPNNMHMLVLDPNAMTDKVLLEKYCWRDKHTGTLLPKYVETLDEKAQKALLNQWEETRQKVAEIAREKERKAVEATWTARVSAAEALLYSIKDDENRKNIYAQRAMLPQFHPQVSEENKARLYKVLNQFGWSNPNEQQQQSSVPKSGSVGPAQDSIWATPPAVQKW